LAASSSSSSTSTSTQPSLNSTAQLHLETDDLDSNAIAYDKLPTSSPTKHRNSAFPYSSAFPLPGQQIPENPRPTSPQSTYSDRLSHALGNFPSNSSQPFPSTSSSFSSRNSSATLGPTLPPNRQDSVEVNVGTRSSGVPAGRPRSPDRQSVRSVTSSVRSGDLMTERERRKRVESLSSLSGRSEGRGSDRDREVRASVASGISQIDQLKPLPASPRQRPNPTLSRSSTATSEAASDMSSSNRYPTMSSMNSYRSADSRTFSSATTTSNRSGGLKTDSLASGVNTSSIPITPRRGSAMSTATRSSSNYPSSELARPPTLHIAPSPFASDFEKEFPRPSDPQKIDELFEQLIPQMGTGTEAEAAIRALETDKKWLMIYNDAFSKWKVAREKITHRPVEARSAPGIGTSTNSIAEYPTTPRASERTPVGRGKNERPEWYIGKFMEGTITQQQVASLSVCLRTYELQYVSILFVFFTSIGPTRHCSTGSYGGLSSSKVKQYWETLFTTLTNQTPIGNLMSRWRLNSSSVFERSSTTPTELETQSRTTLRFLPSRLPSLPKSPRERVSSNS